MTCPLLAILMGAEFMAADAECLKLAKAGVKTADQLKNFASKLLIDKMRGKLDQDTAKAVRDEAERMHAVRKMK